MSNCIIITFPTSVDNPGGGARSCRQIARDLAKLNQEVILVPISRSTTNEIRDRTVQAISVSPHKLHYLLNGVKVARQIKKIINQKTVDAVISWNHEGAFLPKLLKSKKIAFGMIAASPSYEEWVNRKTKLNLFKRLTDSWFRWRLFQEANLVFVSSDFTQNELSRLFKIDSKRMVKIGRGIDEHFKEIERLPSNKVSNLIFYGSLAKIKGVFDTIEALTDVHLNGERDWKLKIAGWGEEEAVRKAVQERGLDQHVSFMGCLSPTELAEELRWAHLAILPSRVESFGRAIAEAQAAGLAVISYNIGSIPEIVEPGVTGWLVPEGRTDLLADAIIEAIKNPQQTFSMGKKGKEVVSEKFSWEKTASSILENIKIAKQQLEI